MGIWDALGLTAGQAVAEPIKATGDALDKLFTSDAERFAFEDKLAQYQQVLSLAQVSTNNIEANSQNWFASSWRPALGWSCAVSVGLNFIVQAILSNIMWVTMCLQQHQLLVYPSPHGLIELTAGILGIYGTQRTIEKMNGVK